MAKIQPSGEPYGIVMKQCNFKFDSVHESKSEILTHLRVRKVYRD